MTDARAAGPKVGIMGAGAIGCYVGGLLAARGSDVVFVGRRAPESGFVLTDLGGAPVKLPRERIAFATEAKALADRDVVLCCVKSGQTAGVAAELAKVLPQSAVTVSFQNGLRNAPLLRDGLAGRATLAGIVGFNVVAGEGGAFRRSTSGPLVIEASPDPRVEALAAALRDSGFETRIARDIVPLQWGKLLMNLNNAVSALSDVPTRDLVLSAGYRKVLAAVIAEALQVMRRAGVRPASLTGLPVGLLPPVLRLPTWIVRAVARTQLKIDPEARSSMWEDITRGRPTEVDELNGEIVRLAEAAGAQAPINRRIVDVVHEVERAGRGSPRLGAEALWQTMTGAAAQ